MQRRFVMVMALSLAACGRRAGETTIAPDPSVRASNPPVEVPKKVEGERLSLFQAKVIDLEARVVAHVLEKDRPVREAMFGDAAYVLNKSGALHAYDVKSGKERWGIATAACSVLAASEGGAFCGKGADVVRHDAKTGVATAVTSKSTANLMHLVAVEGRVLVVRDDRSVESIDGKSGALVDSSTFPFMPYGSRDGVVSIGKGACGASPSWTEVQLHCVDSSAKALYSKTYTLKKPGDPPAMSFLVRQLDAKYMVVSTWFGKTPRRGIVVRVSDGVELANIEEEIVAAVPDKDGGLEGFFVANPTVKFLEPSGAVRWTSSEKLEDAASVVLHDEMIVASSYHPIATGADLHGFDRKSGKTMWKGDVELLPIAHSKYFNHVELSIAFGHVVMRGNEASQNYLEVFDPKDGARKLSEVRGR